MRGALRLIPSQLAMVTQRSHDEYGWDVRLCCDYFSHAVFGGGEKKGKLSFVSVLILAL